MNNNCFIPTTTAERAYDLYLRASELDHEQRDLPGARRLYLEALAFGIGLSPAEQRIALAQAEAIRIVIWRSSVHAAVVVPLFLDGRK
jgi:hypothetical protein